MTSRRITAMCEVFGQVTGARAEGLLPGTCLPGGADLVGGGAKLIALSGFEFVMAGGQGAAGAQRSVGAFPKVAGNVLAAGFARRTAEGKTTGKSAAASSATSPASSTGNSTGR